MASASAINVAPFSEVSSPILVVAAFMVASFTVGLDTRTLAIGLQDLSGAFSLGVDQASWLATMSAAPQILVAPSVAWLVAVFGIRRIMIGPCFVYAAVSFLIPFVSSFGLLITLHSIRGLLLGVFIPATIGVTLRSLDKRYWLIGLAIYSMRIPLSQNVGVCLVGFYTDHLGIVWLYWQDVLLTLLVAFLIHAGTRQGRTDEKMLSTADWSGMLLLGTSMVALYLALDQGERLNWFQSNLIIALFSCGAFLAVIFILNETVAKHPWAHVKVILPRNRLLSLLSVVAFVIASIPTSLVIPSFLETVSGLLPSEIIGLYLLYAVMPIFASTAIAGFMLHHVDARWGQTIGFSLLAVSALAGGFVTPAWGPQNFVLIILVQSVGQAFTILSVIILFLSHADPKQSTANSAYIQVVRLAGSELVVSLAITFLAKREQFHSNILGAAVTKASESTLNTLSKLTKEFHSTSHFASADALIELSGRVRKQAFVLAYADCFYLALCGGIAGLILVAAMTVAPQGPLNPSR